jgi:alkanesulfonate monooxygenase SsuD/methylene tetrahydromethanopterin reductase-like flavin-dependent oxidoreductase (luciferase family)
MRTGRESLRSMLEKTGESPAGSLSLWRQCGRMSRGTRQRPGRALERLAKLLNRSDEGLAEQVLIGGPEECAAKLRRYAETGVDRIFIWPIAEPVSQLETFMREVAI